MRKEDIINKCAKIIYDKYDVVFIIQTAGDNDFWYWIVNRYDIREYFEKSPSALFELASDKLSKNHIEKFINDVKNDCIGVSGGSFESIEDAIKEVMR